MTEARYAGAQWGPGLSGDTVGEDRSDDPSLEQMAQLYHRLAEQHPEMVRVEVLGESVGGNELYLLEVSEADCPEEGRQVALFFGAEHGNEHSAAVALLRLLEWLVTAEAAEVRRQNRVLLIPCVNPDGYDTLHQENMRGVNLYADYSLSGEPTQPESRAVWGVMERYHPEVVGSCHGAWKRVRHAAFENCQGSYGTSRYDRCHSRLFAEEVNRACEEAGYPQDRMEEDAERILPPVPGYAHHAFRSGEGITPCAYAYQRYHSLTFSMEIMWEESGLVKLRRILELGSRPWRYERHPGYPVRVISPPEPFAVVAYGRNAAQRRRSRVELWRACDSLTKIMLPHSEAEGFLGFGLSCVAEDRSLRATYVSEVLDYLAEDANIEGGPVREALGPYLGAWWSLHYDLPAAEPQALPCIEHGVSLRVRLLPGSRVRRVLVNGREATESAEEGYEAWTPPGHWTLLQINLPPGPNLAAPDGRLRRVLCTVEYEPGAIGQGADQG